MYETAKQDGGDFKKTILGLRQEMKGVIFGQDPAIDALDKALKISFAGLRVKNKTAGAFLFLGPTGSGKTETAEQLAKKLGVPCQRIDCAELQAGHEISKLVGSPPGYLGHGETPSMLKTFCDDVEGKPYGVLIFDEIEKAHPALYRLLLGMMDKATVTDGKNNVLKFGNVIVIMTSNIGEQDRRRVSLGFGPQGLPRSKIDPTPVDVETGSGKKALAAIEPEGTASTGKGDSPAAFSAAMLRLVFSPEFMGRIDGVINFADLTPDLIPLIAGKFINGLQQQARENPKGSVDLEVTTAARDYIVANGYQAEKGARSILTFLNEAIVGRLADELLGGQLEGGGKAVIDRDEDPVTHRRSLSFAFTRAAAAHRDNGMAAPAATNAAAESLQVGDVVPVGHEQAGWIYAGISETTHRPFYAAPEDSGVFKWQQAMAFADKRDSRLPSKEELQQLYEAKDKGALSGTFNATGASFARWYWSSSRNDNMHAWAHRFDDGTRYLNLKTIDASVRCVRG